MISKTISKFDNFFKYTYKRLGGLEAFYSNNPYFQLTLEQYYCEFSKMAFF